jgi:hypothetical protein
MASNSQEPADARLPGTHCAWTFVFSAMLLICGCAAPGVPVTRQPKVPKAITDLSARQSGDSIVLSFTLPKQTVQGRAISRPPAIEIYRTFLNTQAAGEAKGSTQPQLITTVLPQMVDQYRQGDRISFPDVLSAADLTAHVDGNAQYDVRTRLGKHDSAASNSVRVQILPAPQPIEDLRAQVTKTAIELSWTTPSILPAGSTPPGSFRYRIYRSEALDTSHAPSANSATKETSAQFVLLGESSKPSYDDTNFTFGHTYAYSVRSVATYPSGSVESRESNLFSVTPRDTFAPAIPDNVAATAASARGSSPAYVDLSWAINTEADLLGYNVYRSDTESNPGKRLNSAPLVTPTFRDESIVAGETYFYRVTAVDRNGNESLTSAPVIVTVPTPRVP